MAIAEDVCGVDMRCTKTVTIVAVSSRRTTQVPWTRRRCTLSRAGGARAFSERYAMSRGAFAGVSHAGVMEEEQETGEDHQIADA
jgi:hypothetical protein